MRINNIGYGHTHDADFFINRPNGSGDHLLLLLKSPAVFTFNGQDTVTEPNSFIIFHKDTPQFYRAADQPFSNDWVHFTADDDDREFFDSLDIPMDRVIKGGVLNSLSLLIKNMCYEHYSSNLFKTDSAELYLKLIFLKLSELIHSSSDTDSTSLYEKLSILRAKIYSQPFNDWNIGGLSHELALSKSYFQHLYKQQFGVSAVNDIISSRVEHGKYLLSTTDISVKQISQMCGYNNENHFMRQFKERTGMTPSQYRDDFLLK